MIDHALRRELAIHADDPLCASSSLRQTYRLEREGWRIRIETEARMSSTATEFTIEAIGEGL